MILIAPITNLNMISQSGSSDQRHDQKHFLSTANSVAAASALSPSFDNRSSILKAASPLGQLSTNELSLALFEQQLRINSLMQNLSPSDWLKNQHQHHQHQLSHRSSSPFGRSSSPVSFSTGQSQVEMLPHQQQTFTPSIGARSSSPTPSLPYKSNKSPKNKYELSDDQVQPMDVLCGRGGKSNNHPGNKYYRQLISDFREKYRLTKGKKDKTGLGYAIVDYIEDQGGRFLKKNTASGHYTILNKAEARRKTSQALRETKELKWTS